MITFANRASAVLYGFLKSRSFEKPFLLPANVCPVVPLSMMKAGVDFEFVDIDVRHTMSEEQALEKVSTGSYSGLLFVHSYGKSFDNKGFYSELKAINPELCIIDDRCLCKPVLEDNVPEKVDLVLYSTGYAKYVELSYGGFGVTPKQSINIEGLEGTFKYSQEDESRQQVYIKDCFKNSKRYELPADYPWLDCSPLKMDAKQYFCIIKAKIEKVKADKDIINKIYRSNIPNELQWGEGFDNWRFMMSVDNRDQLLKAIFDAGLFAGTNFPSISWMFKGQHCKRAEIEASHILNLFNDFRVNEEMAFKTCEIIKANI